MTSATDCSSTFRTTILGSGKSAAGIQVPDDVVASLGRGKRPAVRVTLGDHTYRSTVAVMGGRYMIGVSAENRALAGVQAGDEVDVCLELDAEPRRADVPADFAAALGRAPGTAEYFASLSYSQQRWHVLSIEGAKTAETRQRRIEKSIGILCERRPR
jgi:hypothetical protein